jgi:hypothetical protein
MDSCRPEVGVKNKKQRALLGDNPLLYPEVFVRPVISLEPHPITLETVGIIACRI